MKIPVCEPFLNGREAEYVLDAMQTGWISSSGKYVTEFERGFAAYCGVRYGVAVCNGTVALHLALRAIGIGPGDEVIVPNFTMIATAFAVCYTGAHPVFVDADRNSWNIDPDLVEQKITSRTKAIMPVHLYGLPCDMDALRGIAERKRIALIEDAAEAHGAVYKGRKAGALSAIAAFSFYANKNLTTGEGGMVVTDDTDLWNSARYFKNLCFPLDAPRVYVHSDIGFNYRMSNIHAAIGLAQVERADEYLALRRRNAQLYRALLSDVPGITFQSVPAQFRAGLFQLLLDEQHGRRTGDVRQNKRRVGRLSGVQGSRDPAALCRHGQTTIVARFYFPGRALSGERVAQRERPLPALGELTDRAADTIRVRCYPELLHPMKSEVFGDYSAYYDLLYRDKDYSAEVDYVEQLIHRQRPLESGWKVLDVGSGTGRHAAAFARRGHTVVGVDASQQMVRLAREAAGPSVRFVVGDARHFRLDERFPVALSLFHVASYQTDTADLLAYFQSICAHLEPSGLFVFDCWYGPAVLHQKPGLRVREMEDEKLKVLRIARPELQTEDNCVRVEFEVLVERKADGSLQRLHESHRMRYLFLPEIQDLLARAGLELLRSEEWMTGKPLGLETWSACLVAGKRS